MKMHGFILRFTNITILGLLIALVATGLFGLVWTTYGWVIDLHRFFGWALIALIPWKIGISWRSLKRGFGHGFDRGAMLVVSLFLAALALTTLTLAILWAWRIGPEIVEIPAFRQSVLAWHWILGLALTAPLALHVWRRWPKLKPVDFASRRGFLRWAGFGAAGLAGWWIARMFALNREIPGQPRLISGSRLGGLFNGNAFPITSEPAPDLAADAWRLAVRGVVRSPFSLSYADILALTRREQAATLDCTNGWWTAQSWQGVPLTDLLDRAGIQAGALAVRLSSVTGYSQVFSIAEARQILIATHVGGEVLAPWHGYPARAVVPFRRGWFWVKWLAEINVLDSPVEILSQPFSIR